MRSIASGSFCEHSLLLLKALNSVVTPATGSSTGHEAALLPSTQHSPATSPASSMTRAAQITFPCFDACADAASPRHSHPLPRTAGTKPTVHLGAVSPVPPFSLPACAAFCRCPRRCPSSCTSLHNATPVFCLNWTCLPRNGRRVVLPRNGLKAAKAKKGKS